MLFICHQRSGHLINQRLSICIRMSVNDTLGETQHFLQGLVKIIVIRTILYVLDANTVSACVIKHCEVWAWLGCQDNQTRLKLNSESLAYVAINLPHVYTDVHVPLSLDIYVLPWIYRLLHISMYDYFEIGGGSWLFTQFMFLGQMNGLV